MANTLAEMGQNILLQRWRVDAGIGSAVAGRSMKSNHAFQRVHLVVSARLPELFLGRRVVVVCRRCDRWMRFSVYRRRYLQWECFGGPCTQPLSMTRPTFFQTRTHHFISTAQVANIKHHGTATAGEVNDECDFLPMPEASKTRRAEAQRRDLSPDLPYHSMRKDKRWKDSMFEPLYAESKVPTRFVE